jgi:sulfur relay (sulfurtransferase) DsrF/TusC family protein
MANQSEMDLIILNDGLYQLVPLTEQMMEHISLSEKVDCFDLCDILRLKLTTFVDSLNRHVMNDDSGYFFGCICK